MLALSVSARNRLVLVAVRRHLAVCFLREGILTSCYISSVGHREPGLIS